MSIIRPYTSLFRERDRQIVALSLALASTILILSGAVPVNADAQGRWGSLQSIGPDTIADIAQKVGPAVVDINSAVGGNLRLRGGGRGREEVQSKVTGSGVIVRADGYILTSLHVVENPIKISVSLADGRDIDATVVGRDRYSDLAMLKIEAHDLSVVKFGNSDTLRLGDWVIAIGDQFGLGHTVTHGLISGLSREAKGFENSFGARTGAVRFIQTDAPINRGSSGGPLIDLKGEVVGISAFIRDDAQNIGFAIPSNLAREVADKLMNAGAIHHPYIGIIMKDPPLDPLQPSAASSTGVEVIEIKPKSPAAKAGLVPGDVIEEVDQSKMRRSDDVSLAVGKRHVGDTLKVLVRRAGGQKLLNVTVDELPETD